MYDYQHVMGTMLHELTHMVHGPHNKAFYKVHCPRRLWHQLCMPGQCRSPHTPRASSWMNCARRWKTCSSLALLVEVEVEEVSQVLSALKQAAG